MEPDEAEATVADATAALRTHAKALNAARYFEIDDVVDPAETRDLIVATVTRASTVR